MHGLEVGRLLVLGRTPRQWCAGRHRRLEVEHRLERLVVDDHRFGCVLRRGLALGDDQRDRVPHEDDLRARKRLV